MKMQTSYFQQLLEIASTQTTSEVAFHITHYFPPHAHRVVSSKRDVTRMEQHFKKAPSCAVSPAIQVHTASEPFAVCPHSLVLTFLLFLHMSCATKAKVPQKLKLKSSFLTIEEQERKNTRNSLIFSKSTINSPVVNLTWVTTTTTSAPTEF